MALPGKPFGVSVEIVSVLVRGGPGHASWRSADPYTFVALGLCDLGRAKLKGLVSQGRFTTAHRRLIEAELATLGLKLESWDRARGLKPPKGKKKGSKRK